LRIGAISMTRQSVQTVVAATSLLCNASVPIRSGGLVSGLQGGDRALQTHSQRLLSEVSGSQVADGITIGFHTNSVAIHERAAARGATPTRRRRIGLTWFSLLFVDFVSLSASVIVGWFVLTAVAPGQASAAFVPACLLLVPALLVGLAIHGAYGQRRAPRVQLGLSKLPSAGLSVMTGVALALLATTTVPASPGPSLTAVEAFAMSSLALIFVPLMRTVTEWALDVKGTPSRVLIVGSGRVAKSLVARLARCGGTVVVGLVDDDPMPGEVVIGRLADLPALCARHNVDRVIVAFSRTPSHEAVELLQRLQHKVAISVVPRMYEMLSWRSTLEELDGVPLLNVAPQQDSVFARIGKRVIDVTGAVAGLILLAPLLGAIAVAIKVSSPGPVFFRQVRTGRDGQPFTILKFRTMEVDAEKHRYELVECNAVDGPIFKMRDDPRVTNVGETLRSLSLDELPQLVNVLCGEMSLVGPRPFPVEESAQINGWAATRFKVRPGMTGLWQVCGRNELTYDDLRHLDSVYVASWSLWWDVRILLQTPVCVLRRRGAL
jgi:exopolysaccharide biosynthesis polyprenyl glycosylphosphotransferase